MLAADDSAVNREVVREALIRLGITATIVEDGAAAVEAMRRDAFDVVLMDCSMPGMDGFEATRAIRRMEAETGRARTPIFALTAHVPSASGDWRAAGMDDYLTKPFTISILAAALANYMAPAAGTAAQTIGEPDSPAASEDRLAPAVPASASANAPEMERGSNKPEGDDPITDERSDAAERKGASDFSDAILADVAAIDAGGGDIVERTLALFETHSKPAILKLAETAKADDRVEGRRAAHALKSMCLNAGAERLARECANFEAACDAPGSDLAAAFLPVRDAFMRAHYVLPTVRARYARRVA